MKTKVTESAASDMQVLDFRTTESMSDVIFECPTWLDDILDED